MNKLALLFPGQGSQKPGMGADLLEGSPGYREKLELADQVLGWKLSNVMLEGTEDDLRSTDVAQLAVFVMSCAILSDLDILPEGIACAAGHSLGEYSALVAAGSLDFEVGLRLVQTRATLMAEAAAKYPGTMAAILGLGRGEVEAAIEAISGIVVANHNSPEQTVISGSLEGIKTASAALTAAGAKRVVPLSVSGAFHSPLMHDAADRFKEAVGAALIKDAAFPVIANSTGQAITSAEDIRRELAIQITSPVEWVSSLQTMEQLGAVTLVEIGPGKVLSGLVRRTLDAVSTFNIEGLGQLEALDCSDVAPILRRKYVHA